MQSSEREDYISRLKSQAEQISAWENSSPDPLAQFCNDSPHRTMGHLRACQEQWLNALQAFVDRDNPSVSFLHPWRHFEAQAYQSVSWESHLEKFMSDRELWIKLISHADWERGGRWNRKQDTVGGLTVRLVRHEQKHLADISQLNLRKRSET